MNRRLFLTPCVLFLLALSALLLHAAEPKPLVSFPFDGDAFGILANGQKINGVVVARSPFTDGVHGQALVIKRWAYDQKSSVGWNHVTIPRAATVTFQMQPMWEGPQAPHELLNIITPSGELALTITADGKLLLKLSAGTASDSVQLPASTLHAGFNGVAVTFDLDQATFALETGGQRAEGKLSDPAAYAPMLQAPATLRLGGHSDSNYDGDAAEAAFDDMKIYAGVLTGDDLASALASSSSVAGSGPGTDESPAWLTRFTGQDVTPYEQKLWSLDDAESNQTATRREVSLNGRWQFAPVFPGSVKLTDRYYSRLSGTWLNKRSAKFTVTPENGKNVEKIGNVSLDTCFQGWYDRKLLLPADFKGKHLTLKIKHSGAAKARFFVNGTLVGMHEMTGHYEQGMMQLLRFDVSKFANEALLDVSIEITFEGPDAMSRVALLDISLERIDGPVRAETPRITTAVGANKLTLAGKVDSTTDAPLPPGATAEAIIHDAQGKIVLTLPAVPVATDGSYQIEGQGSSLTCWSPDNPCLYTATIVVRDGGKTVLDEAPLERFGWRELTMGDSHFYLNGSKFRLIYNSCSNAYGLRMEAESAQPGFAHEAIAAYRKAGFNAVVVDNVWNKNETQYFRNESPVWQEQIIKACDELGMLVVFKAPEFVSGTKSELFRPAVADIIRYWNNHPSICFWLDDFNKCMYVMEEAPSMVNDYAYVPTSPKGRAAARKWIVQGDAIYNEFDPSRIVYHNAGGNISKLYTVMQYMSFGLPLQEREDWPSQWLKKNLYMATEFGFPYPGQFLDFGDPLYTAKARELVTENAARFFGEDIYAQSDRDANAIGPFRGSENITELRKDVPGDVLIPELGGVKKLLAANNIRAWRGYDVSGMGIFFEDNGLFVMPYIQGKTYWGAFINGPTEAQSKCSGFHPDSIGLEERYLDPKRPTDYFTVFQRALSPMVAYIVQDGPRWNAKDHAYFAGETLKKQVMVLNDTLEHQDLALDVHVTDASGKDLLTIDRTLPIDAGERAMVPVSTLLPDVPARTDLKITAKLKQGDKEVWSEEFPVQEFPAFHPAPPKLKAARIAVYDPKGLTTAALARMGLPARRVSSANDLGDANTLIVGREALGTTPDSFLAAVEQSGAIERGLNVIVFEQKECALGNFIFQEERQRTAFITNRAHPILAGLVEKDFADWRGTSDLCVDIDKPTQDWDGIYLVFPTFRYTCGSLGIVASNVIRKPIYGSFRPILSCGFDLANSPLTEVQRGAGKVILCQLDVTSRYGVDPVATRVIENLVTYADSIAAPQLNAHTPVRLGVCDPGNLLGPLGSFAGGFKALADLDQLDGLDVVVAAGVSQDALGKASSSIASFTGRGGKLVVLGRPPDGPLTWSPVPVTVQGIHIVRALAQHDPALPGWISNADLYFRTTYPAAAFAAPGAAYLDDHKTIASIPAGQGRLYLLGYDPADLAPVARDLTANKSFRITAVPTYYDTIESDGLLNGTLYTSFIDVLVSMKPIRLVHSLLDQLGAFDTEPLFTSATYQNGKLPADPSRTTPAITPYPANYPVLDVNAFHNW